MHVVKPSIEFHILAKFYGETSVKAKMNDGVVEDLTHQQKTGQPFYRCRKK